MKFIVTLFSIACAMIIPVSAQTVEIGKSGGNHVIVQENKNFLNGTDNAPIKRLQIKKGETIVFENKDPVTHNVYSKSGEYDFEVTKQETGTPALVHFDKTGQVKIRCAIHPKMKLIVDVIE